jgi:hypothetical protein
MCGAARIVNAPRDRLWATLRQKSFNASRNETMHLPRSGIFALSCK